jgi:hypothetical protein
MKNSTTRSNLIEAFRHNGFTALGIVGAAALMIGTVAASICVPPAAPVVVSPLVKMVAAGAIATTLPIIGSVWDSILAAGAGHSAEHSRRNVVVKAARGLGRGLAKMRLIPAGLVPNGPR